MGIDEKLVEVLVDAAMEIVRDILTADAPPPEDEVRALVALKLQEALQKGLDSHE